MNDLYATQLYAWYQLCPRRICDTETKTTYPFFDLWQTRKILGPSIYTLFHDFRLTAGDLSYQFFDVSWQDLLKKSITTRDEKSNPSKLLYKRAGEKVSVSFQLRFYIKFFFSLLSRIIIINGFLHIDVSIDWNAFYTAIFMEIDSSLWSIEK